MSLEERIKNRRRILGISQEELGELIGVHENTIRTWEKGTRCPDTQKISLLAEALKTTMAYLLGETNNPDKNALIPNQIQSFTNNSEYQDRTEIKDSVPSVAFWGSLVDNAERAAEEGKHLKVIIALVYEALEILKNANNDEKNKREKENEGFVSTVGDLMMAHIF